tara:strand:- start:240 stop:1616 length:1377 start_codon:yes stop_codon:yes gene_type:complete
MKAKSCRSGYYWCFDDKKCKKIPLGYHIGARGYLYPDKDNDGNSDGNGNGKNGNGNGSNHSGNSGSNGGSGGGVSEGTTMQENFKRINQNGQTYAVMLQFRGRTYNIQMFIPKQTRPTRLEVQKEVNKIYPGSIVRYFEPRVWDPASPALVMPEQMQPGAKDLVQQSNYMKPALQQKKQKKPVKNDCGCKEEFTLKSVNEVLSVKDTKKLKKASVLSASDNPKDWESARARRTEIDYKDLMKQRKVKENLTYDIDPKKHKQERRDAKIGNLARKTTNPGEKAAAQKKSKGPKLFGEDTVRVEGQLGYVEFIDLIKPEPMKGIAERKLTKGEEKEKERVVKGMKKSFKGFRDRYGDEAKSVMYATATKLAKEEVSRGNKPSNVKKKKKLESWLIDKEVRKIKNEELATHIKKGVAAAKPLVKAQALQTGLPTTKEKPKPPEKKSSKSIFSQLTNKDEID